MSFFYVVTPLLEDEAFTRWLDEFGIIPPPGATSRLPTIRELCSILEQLEGFSFEVSKGSTHWDADIFECGQPGKRESGEYTTIWVSNYEGNEESPVDFCFRKGSARLVLLILRHLTPLCGPLVIVLDTCCIPILVTPETDVDRAQHVWDA
ncbi:hypothetical protein EPA93_22860 [Ktedonosporobacter rubrisoli]|uniref:Uncharacterized protein n=1 Tax=Ktedonosporobacter rubrisoli TaxID=2509675 RepID=A0A4P6JTR4_KTERU|nr:hypothetical protein [Ktedonosporobacter rubrisoli]QBD78672.1 hypothetical protein EPA93_22860 [Ktedonosporobacter rubrisoli]